MPIRSNSDPRRSWQRSQPRPTRNSPPSTAWLEAQAAFSAPVPAAPAARTGSAPVVVVRRSRPLDGQVALVAGAAPGTPAELARPARVFRVVAVAPAEAASLPAPAQAPTAAAVQAAASSLARPQRARSSRQAPGVGTVISFRPPTVARAAPVLTYREQMAQLLQMMAELDETIAAVRWAQSFELRC